ncbi:MAG: glycine--tRNA ligase subunit beta, partial [Phototrophicales bacterium]
AETERHPIRTALFQQPEERALYDAYQAAAAKLTPTGNVDEFLSAFAPILPAITAFFDAVLVNADDPALRKTRLGLLQAISAMQHGRADLSHLTGF